MTKSQRQDNGDDVFLHSISNKHLLRTQLSLRMICCIWNSGLLRRIEKQLGIVDMECRIHGSCTPSFYPEAVNIVLFHLIMAILRFVITLGLISFLHSGQRVSL